MEKGMVDQWKKINNKDNKLKNFCHWVLTSTTIIMDFCELQCTHYTLVGGLGINTLY